MSRAGIFVNCIALLFLTWIWIFCFFPAEVDPTPSGMNWNILINGGVMILAFMYYRIWAKKFYTGPVALVKEEA